jgi:hypothetical protein
VRATAAPAHVTGVGAWGARVVHWTARRGHLETLGTGPENA